MAKATLGGFLQQLRKTMAAETLASLPDGELIGRFLARHDEASFHALMHRHGPMVLRVCRRALPDEQDVEDAFQATFLVLAREADAIRKRASLASWLHGVAHRVALDARKAGVRRRKHEAQAATRTGSVALMDEVGWKELRCVLDEELVRLPDRLRAPLVLCYLEGLTQDEAAARLGQSKSTFRRNLERGRARLGVRLTRRGVTLSAALFALLLSECAAAAAVPAALAATTAAAAVALAAGKAVAVLASARALALAGGLAQPALSAKVKAVGVLLVAAVLAGLGGATVSKDHNPVAPTPPVESQEVAKTEAVNPPAAAKDLPTFGGGNAHLFSNERVQKELKLTAEQVKSVQNGLEKVQEKYREEISRVGGRIPGAPAVPGGGGGLDPEQFAALTRKVGEENHKVIAGVLKPEQVKRLKQIALQFQGVRGLQSEEVVKALDLTDDQKRRGKTLVEDFVKDSLNLVQRDPAERQKAYQKLFKEAAEKIPSILTPDQRKKWKELTGAPFELWP